MKVNLINYTGFGFEDPARFAANLLLFTKSTRLELTPKLLDDFKSLSEEKRNEELKYMASTIPSSWEFVDFTFLIEGVTRAFTHQLVRTRVASFAQQSMRVTNLEGFNYLTGPSIEQNKLLKDKYDKTMSDIDDAYNVLVTSGAQIEDARGVLPTNILTNIIMKINMRNFIDMIKKRSGKRTQDEYRNVMDAATIEVVRVYPWFHMFAKLDLIEVAKTLEEKIMGNHFISKEDKTSMFKLVDQLRSAL